MNESTLVCTVNDTLVSIVNDTLVSTVNDTLVSTVNDTLVSTVNDTLVSTVNAAAQKQDAVIGDRNAIQSADKSGQATGDTTRPSASDTRPNDSYLVINRNTCDLCAPHYTHYISNVGK